MWCGIFILVFLFCFLKQLIKHRDDNAHVSKFHTSHVNVFNFEIKSEIFKILPVYSSSHRDTVLLKSLKSEWVSLVSTVINQLVLFSRRERRKIEIKIRLPVFTKWWLLFQLFCCLKEFRESQIRVQIATNKAISFKLLASNFHVCL